jgi:hypothetical protein
MSAAIPATRPSSNGMMGVKRDGHKYSDLDVRAYLRAAVNEGLLRSWNYFNSTVGPAPGYGNSPWPRPGPLRWTVSPAHRATIVYDEDEIREYCFLLNAAGIVPLYIGA